MPDRPTAETPTPPSLRAVVLGRGRTPREMLEYHRAVVARLEALLEPPAERVPAARFVAGTGLYRHESIRAGVLSALDMMERVNG